MSCFYHHDRQSVGGCKSCGKALCPECAVDLGKGLACRNQCEADVQALIALIDRNIKMASVTKKIIEANRTTRLNGAIFNIIIGVIFVCWGLRDLDRYIFLLVIGIFFFAFGLIPLFKIIAAPKVPIDKAE